MYYCISSKTPKPGLIAYHHYTIAPNLMSLERTHASTHICIPTHSHAQPPTYTCTRIHTPPYPIHKIGLVYYIATVPQLKTLLPTGSEMCNWRR